MVEVMQVAESGCRRWRRRQKRRAHFGVIPRLRRLSMETCCGLFPLMARDSSTSVLDRGAGDRGCGRYVGICSHPPAAACRWGEGAKWKRQKTVKYVSYSVQEDGQKHCGG